MKKYKAIGVMSGSSLDGIDLAYCEFWEENEAIQFELIAAETIPFTEMWQARLEHLPSQSALIFAKTHVYFGHYLAELLNIFIEKHQLSPDFIASHGHTIFHDPERRFTTQIGDGAAIAALTKCRVISDFRTQDVALNGEGTPIAPAADRYLFADFDFLMNIGGIANLTFNQTPPIAFDVTAANQILNAIAATLNLKFDQDGILASNGNVQEEILEELAKIPYFRKRYPKSIANSWVREQILPLFTEANCSPQDKLRTMVEHIGRETAFALHQILHLQPTPKAKYNLLITGGGAFNRFLVETIQEKVAPLNVEVTIPEPAIIEYKEAILMGLMGVLRLENRVNCFSSVTGADRNTIGGAVFEGG